MTRATAQNFAELTVNCKPASSISKHSAHKEQCRTPLFWDFQSNRQVTGR